MIDFLISAIVIFFAIVFGIAWLMSGMPTSSKIKRKYKPKAPKAVRVAKKIGKKLK